MTTEERFWPKVYRRGSDECWPWVASFNPAGYGQMAMRCQNGKWRPITAHRISWELAHGPIPEGGKPPHGMCVCHRCDNRACVNPAHLFLADQPENVADCVRKERHNRGSINGQAKLTEEQVSDIKGRLRLGERQRHLAAEFGVHQTTVHHIAVGACWGHISPSEAVRTAGSTP